MSLLAKTYAEHAARNGRVLGRNWNNATKGCYLGQTSKPSPLASDSLNLSILSR